MHILETNRYYANKKSTCKKNDFEYDINYVNEWDSEAHKQYRLIL